jgi:hypothetical protein
MKRRPRSTIDVVTVSSGPSISVTSLFRKNARSSRIAVSDASVVTRNVIPGIT